MYVDSRLEFSRDQALTASGPSQNVIDLGSDRDIGPGRPMWVVIAVTADADHATGDETYAFALQTDDNEAFASPTAIASVAPAAASLTAGTHLVIGMPFANERYLRLNSTLGGTTPGITIDAFLTDQEPSSWQAYPDAI